MGLKDFLKQLGDIKDNDTCRNVMIAGAFRSFGNMIVSCYLPVFFQKIYPQFSSEYSIVTSAALMFFGVSSVMGGGIIGDKFESTSYMTKSLICIIGGLLAYPMIAAAVLLQGNFWLSLFLASSSIFVSGSYFAPAITMMQNTSSASNSGNVVSAYTFITTIA